MSDAGVGVIDPVASPVTGGIDNVNVMSSGGEKRSKKSGEKNVGDKKQVKQAKKKAVVSPTHPPIQQMVDAAIKNLKERSGSSLLAIKKYINTTYKCDSQKLAPFIKKYLKSSVINGKLIQTKGKGASGSFKLSMTGNKDSKIKIKSNIKASSITEKKKKTMAIKEKSTVTVADKKKKKMTAGVKAKKVVASGASDEKKSPIIVKKKISEKKKIVKDEVKSIKKAGTVKSKPMKMAGKSPATKPKTPKVKNATITTAKKTSKPTQLPKKLGAKRTVSKK